MFIGLQFVSICKPISLVVAEELDAMCKIFCCSPTVVAVGLHLPFPMAIILAQIKKIPYDMSTSN